MTDKNHNVVVLGASQKEERYSNKAIRLLKKHHYSVIPIHPKLHEIENLDVVHRLNNIQEKVDTLTIYLGPQRIKPLIEDIIDLNPRRVILNPGTESPELESRLEKAGIHYIRACTLVLLQTGQFESYMS